MTKDERIEMLEEATCAIAQALEDIRMATDNDAHTEAYLCASLSVIVSEGRYLSNDLTIEQVIEELDEDAS